MYIPRSAEKTLEKLRKQFKVVLVTGARQVGKTTMLKHSYLDTYNYVTLDTLHDRTLAQDDPSLFFKDYRRPLILDEVQKAPELFEHIKYLVDQTNEKGTIILTGSQTFQLMKGVSESLAGRVAILEMTGLSLREVLHSTKEQPYIPQNSRDRYEKPGSFDVWHHIWRGSMPELQDKSIDWSLFFSNYTSTYLERDVRDLIRVKDEERFYRFIVSAAARTGQLLNAESIANDVGVDMKTIQSWVSVLQASGIIRLLRPIHVNIGKRLTKTAKLYFMDTGLACYLLGWNSAETLKNGAMSGQIFETFVVSEVLKSYLNAGLKTENIFFYRDTKKREIDLVIQEGQVLHPIEIKKSASPGKDAIANFFVLNNLSGFEVGTGAVLCQTDISYSISEGVRAEPLWSI
jgi:predicted AAA+ superfamily ATPase